MFGRVTNPANEHLPDLNMREYATLIPLVVLAFWIGIYPKPLFVVLDVPVRRIVEQVNPGYYNAARIPDAPKPVTAAAQAPVQGAAQAAVRAAVQGAVQRTIDPLTPVATEKR